MIHLPVPKFGQIILLDLTETQKLIEDTLTQAGDLLMQTAPGQVAFGIPSRGEADHIALPT